MKKVLLAVALTALCGLTASTYADVQNIRISGDIRVIGYYLANVGYSGGAQAEGNVNLFEQQTRVKIEADLEDHVLVVVGLKADGLWGNTDAWNQAHNSAKTWFVGLDEAYVQLRELFYSPATLTLGRQYLNYGSGLIISSFDKAYNFDAARLVLDYHPLTIDVVAAQLNNDQGYVGYNVSGTAAIPQTDLLFVNAKYEVNGSMVKTVEGYFGWKAQSGNNSEAPMIVGLRTDLTPCENLTASVEGAYEFANGGGNEISAFIAKVNAKYTFKGVTWTPAVNASYTYASGGGENGQAYFRPWFNMADGYNGYVLAPALSNIQIINLGISAQPAKNTSLSLQGYYYLKADRNGFVYSDRNADLGGNPATGLVSGFSSSRDIGGEVDAIVGYDYSKDVRCQLVYGMMFPGDVFDGVANRVANEVRGEINVKF